jgi:proliferating cell nuclear antigen
MKFVISDKDKVGKFHCIMKNMKSLLSEVNFSCTGYGLYIQGMDASHVGLFELKLERAWFNEYEDIGGCTQTLGINCEAMSMIMNCHSDGQSITFIYKEDKPLVIKFEGKGHDKMFELKLMDIENELMGIPDTDYDADITMASSEFNKLMAENSLFADTLAIKLGEDDNIYMSADGDMGKMKVRIKEDDIIEYVLTDSVIMNHEYSLKYCLLYSKFTKINKAVSLHFMDDTPLKIMYDLSHWIDEDCDPQVVNDDEESRQNNYLGFYLAPKINEEEN